ncbi:hypothetical protein ACLMJK_009086 [Lecanora helva]
MGSGLLPRTLDDPNLDGQIHSQWKGPSDILSLLLLVGSDVIQRAIAQQAGSKLPTPVVFSFGWVAYAFAVSLSAVGDNLLMPPPDISCVVISCPSGHVKTNQSWVLGRILRDFELTWMTKEAREGLRTLLENHAVPKKSLCVSVWEPSLMRKSKQPVKDWTWWSGYLVLVLQLGLAGAAWGYWGDWAIFAITSGGTLLALITASLPQWRRERWPCRENTSKSFVLCRGNGCQHALVIWGNGAGLDFEDLASTGEGTTTESYTRVVIVLLTAGWVVFLITVSGVRSQTWFLVGIGAIGMLHTVFVAGKSRDSSSFGVPLTPREYVLEENVMTTLEEVERKYPGVGLSMVSTFFPGGLSGGKESDFWRKQQETRKERLQELRKSNNAKHQNA